MNKHQAIEEISDLGYSYFYDEIGHMTDNEIVEWMQDHVRGTGATGMIYWENRRDGLQIVLAECSDQELDDFLLRYYGHAPEDVGGSRQFFSWLHSILAETIASRKRDFA